MNICGILVHTQPDGIETMKERLVALPGVEIHAVDELAKFLRLMSQKNGVKWK